MKLVNLTPHAINIVTPLTTITIPPSGTVARLVSAPPAVLPPIEVDGHAIPVSPAPEFLRAEGLDDNLEDIIVSAMVGGFIASHPQEFAALAGRVFGPDTSPAGAVRENGQIIGVKGLIRYF